ncbi:DUF1868 domain-containing protein [Cylindrospermopsis raciborskii CHAB3438]|uniref:DUF1868 domain-containing protein n=2 Tax=Cylindrospermopsis raciborskii TaxID=77022 RepID=A0A853M8P5_9CYAN|nr:hypothetical protein [Cylindrospermopsis raciborskii]EFA69097.1 hypothetical protein CRC_02458 [Cylindrospermopsis raciborskii CS-505]MCH4904270.1 DUF1868 domain-containing protein [Cylindrospermopsis raciborskii CHAB3438]MEB3146543.1 DUF1868 domain-containing protein [Cylindrospermopsis raciborskii]OBU74922.1 DUF1868 domain-containing protein [Cylindrospermopsis raciborskii CS-505]OHY41621.1 DUF1868 domain-containing protein [Cylindrospermopsis raciborskii CS-508]
MDDNYQTYLNRLARMTLPDSFRTQVQHIQESSKFQSVDGVLRATPFPGYTLITPPASEDPQNADFYKQIETFGQLLLELPIASDLIVPLPVSSFHVTLADLIWDHAFIHACEKKPDFEEELNSYLGDLFSQYQKSRSSSQGPISWQVLGVIVMPRAIALGLIPKDERSYEEIIQLRRLIYQNRKLMGLGIEQHYHFTAHITLGYFSEIPANLDRVNLSNLLSELNQYWLLNFSEIVVSQAEVRKFDDMTHYYRQPNWASFRF